MVSDCNVRRPEVVISAHSSVRPIVTLAVIFENSFVEARRIILKVSTIQRSKVFMRISWRRGRVDDFRTSGYLKSSSAMP